MPVTVGATKSGGTCHPIRWPQQRFLSLICIFRPAAVRPLRSLWGTGRAGLVGLSYVIDTGCVGHSEITSSSLLLPSRKVNRPPSSISTALRRSNSCSVPVSGSSKRGIQVPYSTGLERGRRRRLRAASIDPGGQRVVTHPPPGRVAVVGSNKKKEKERTPFRLVARTRPFEERACLRQLDELVEVSAYCTIDCRSR